MAGAAQQEVPLRVAERGEEEGKEEEGDELSDSGIYESRKFLDFWISVWKSRGSRGVLMCSIYGRLLSISLALCHFFFCLILFLLCLFFSLYQSVCIFFAYTDDSTVGKYTDTQSKVHSKSNEGVFSTCDFLPQDLEWWGCRHTLCLMGLLGTATAYTIRTSLSMAIVAMVGIRAPNHTMAANTSAQDGDVCPIPEDFDASPRQGLVSTTR